MHLSRSLSVNNEQPDVKNVHPSEIIPIMDRLKLHIFPQTCPSHLPSDLEDRKPQNLFELSPQLSLPLRLNNSSRAADVFSRNQCLGIYLDTYDFISLITLDYRDGRRGRVQLRNNIFIQTHLQTALYRMTVTSMLYIIYSTHE